MHKWNTEYRIIDDFFKTEDLKIIQEYFKDRSSEPVVNINGVERNEDINVVSVDPFDDHKIDGFDVKDPYVLKLFIKYNNKLVKLLKELAPKSTLDYGKSMIEFVQTKPNNECKVVNKSNVILSVSIYISPEESSGTILYKDKNQSDPYEIEWKENRAFIFSQNNESWHGYKNILDKDRNTITWDLMSDANC